MTEPENNLDELIKQFGNNLAMHLTPSNEAMKAVRFAREVFADTLHQELQKARHNWLREEIVKLEGMKKREMSTEVTTTDNPFAAGIIALNARAYNKSIEEYNQALQAIIDRYQSELDQPTDEPISATSAQKGEEVS